MKDWWQVNLSGVSQVLFRRFPGVWKVSLIFLFVTDLTLPMTDLSIYTFLPEKSTISDGGSTVVLKVDQWMGWVGIGMDHRVGWGIEHLIQTDMVLITGHKNEAAKLNLLIKIKVNSYERRHQTLPPQEPINIWEKPNCFVRCMIIARLRGLKEWLSHFAWIEGVKN